MDGRFNAASLAKVVITPPHLRVASTDPPTVAGPALRSPAPSAALYNLNAAPPRNLGGVSRPLQAGKISPQISLPFLLNMCILGSGVTGERPGSSGRDRWCCERPAEVPAPPLQLGQLRRSRWPKGEQAAGVRLTGARHRCLCCSRCRWAAQIRGRQTAVFRPRGKNGYKTLIVDSVAGR
jgi:hypothetical protein